MRIKKRWMKKLVVNFEILGGWNFMAGKLKLLVCCGNGAGTSMMIKLNVEKVIK